MYLWHRKLTGTKSFCTSSTALASFILALFSESSTVISTCKSSDKCSQFGLPRFASSCGLNGMVSDKVSSWGSCNYTRGIAGNYFYQFAGRSDLFEILGCHRQTLFSIVRAVLHG